MRNSLLLVLFLCFVGCVALIALGACGGRDYQAEERIRADAAVQAARITADAAVQTTTIEQAEATKRNTALISVLPVLLLIVAVAGVVWLAVWFRGRERLMVTAALVQIPEFVQAEALRRGLLAQRDGDSWLLVDAAQRPKARLTARE